MGSCFVRTFSVHVMDAQQQCKLFVGSLSFDTDEDGLREFFSDCGVIEDVFLPTDRYSGRKRGFGFVTFADANAAAAGVAKDQMDLDGRTLTVNVAESPKPNKEREPKPQREYADQASAGPAQPQLKCFVGNLSWDTSEETVANFFKDCGQTTDVYFPTDRDGRPRGFGFITFAELGGSAAAVALNGVELDGRGLRINYEQPKGKGGGKGKGKK